MPKADELVRGVGGPAAPRDSEAKKARGRDEFVGMIDSQRKTRIPPRSLDQTALAEGASRLKSSDPASHATVVAGRPPLVFFDMRSSWRAADFDVAKIHFVYWGWDLNFGGSLTITAMYQQAGTFGRAYIAGDDAALADFKAGRFVCVHEERCARRGDRRRRLRDGHRSR